MFNHPIKVAFVVGDVSAAVRFFTELMDLRIEARFPSGTGPGEDFVFLRSETIYIELLPRKAMGGAPPGFHHLAFLVDNVDQRLAELHHRGATVAADAFDAGVGGIRLGDVEGPDGVLLRLFSSGRLAQQTPPSAITMEDLVPAGGTVEKIAGGFAFTEGPVWHGADKSLYFSDIPASMTRRLDRSGRLSIVRSPNGKSNGMAVDLDGELLICQHAMRRVVRYRRADHSETVVADQFEGKRFNSPNDIVVKSDGSVYFTDPPYGLSPEFGRAGEPELPFCGVYRLDPTRRAARCVSTSFFRPNGLCFSPDERVLYVNDSEQGLIRSYDIAADGGLINERLFAEVRGDAPGVPDGMKTDRLGNVWVTGPGGLWIFDPEGAKIGLVPVPEVAANLCFGEDDGRTVFITASTSLYRIRVNVRGW